MPASRVRTSADQRLARLFSGEWWRRQAATNGRLHGAAKPQEPWRDALLVAGLALAIFTFILHTAQRLPDWLLVNRDYFDVWFDGDSPRYIMHMTDRLSDTRDRSFMHPLLSWSYFPVAGLRALFALGPYAAVRVFLGLIAAAWVAVLYGLLRLLRLPREDAALVCLLGGVSASAMFWFPVPESWALGSVTILLALIFVAATEQRRVPVRWYIVVSTLTMAISVTNWMLGLIIAFVAFSWRRAVWISLAAFGGMGLACVVNAFIFPTFKIGFPEYAHEYIFQPEAGGIFHVLTAFVWHPIVAPAFRVASGWDHPHVLRMTFQQMIPGSASPWGAAAVVLWTALFGLGAWAAASIAPYARLRRVVGLMLAGQLLLHAIYGGGEVFLYSMHWLPCLLVLVACALLTRLRRLVLALTAALIVCAAFNNLQQLDGALLFANNDAAIRGRFDDPNAFDPAHQPVPPLMPPKWARPAPPRR